MNATPASIQAECITTSVVGSTYKAVVTLAVDLHKHVTEIQGALSDLNQMILQPR